MVRRGCLPGHLGPTQGLERRGDALPRTKHGDLQGHHQRTTDHDYWRIHIALFLRAPTGLGGGPETLPGPRYHSDRGPQRQHRKTPEPALPTGC